MGMILTEAQRPHIGEFHYRRVLEISGARDPILLANLAGTSSAKEGAQRRAGFTMNPLKRRQTFS
jgi:hypothetical protein